MAIDPKELRIGSHILVKGKRVEIECIINNSQIAYYLPNYDDWEACSPDEDWVEPIPITEELLTELGFSKKFMAGDWSMWTMDIDSFSVSVGLQDSICRGVEIKDNDDKKAMFGWSYPCKYLHELESFYHHCINKELIKE